MFEVTAVSEELVERQKRLLTMLRLLNLLKLIFVTNDVITVTCTAPEWFATEIAEFNTKVLET